MKRHVFRILAALWITAVPASAWAGSATFSGQIISSDPTMPVVSIATPNCTAQGAFLVHYRAFPFTVDSSGSYAFTSPPLGSLSIASFYVYAGSFDPASPLANCIAASNSANETVGHNISEPLTAGVNYILVVFDDQFSQVGANYSITISGPGNIHGACAGFTDVDIASGFCANVQWLRNRSVTLGCTSSTLYCPNDSVTRLQMAAFMHRLANAIHRAVVHVTQSGVSATNDVNASGVVCRTPAYTVDVYRRAALPASVGFFHRAATPVRVSTRLVYSLDSGATWTNFGSLAMQATNIANEYAAQSPAAGPRALAAGQSIMFGIRTTTSGTVNDAGCELAVQIDSVTDTIAPFDPQPDRPSDTGR